MPKSKSVPSLFAHLLFFKEQLEWFAPVDLYKRANMSDSLRLLMTKVWWERFALFRERITLLLPKNELIAQKTDERIPNHGPKAWNQIFKKVSTKRPVFRPSKWVKNAFFLSWKLSFDVTNNAVVYKILPHHAAVFLRKILTLPRCFFYKILPHLPVCL